MPLDEKNLISLSLSLSLYPSLHVAPCHGAHHDLPKVGAVQLKEIRGVIRTGPERIARAHRASELSSGPRGAPSPRLYVVREIGDVSFFRASRYGRFMKRDMLLGCLFSRMRSEGFSFNSGGPGV